MNKIEFNSEERKVELDELRICEFRGCENPVIPPKMRYCSTECNLREYWLRNKETIYKQRRAQPERVAQYNKTHRENLKRRRLEHEQRTQREQELEGQP